MSEEKSSFDDRFRIDQKGLDEGPLSGKTRYSRRRTNGISTIKVIALTGVLITLIVVMVIIFKSPGNVNPLPEKNEVDPIASNVAMVALLEQRMERLESALDGLLEKVSATKAGSGASQADMTVFTGRVDRVETAMSAKFNIIVENLDKLDIQMADVVNRVKTLENKRGESSAGRGESSSLSSAGAPPVKTVVTTAIPPVKTTAAKDGDKKTALKKNSSSEKNTSPSRVYHVVQKGETFYSISKKYDTTVDQIHRLNQFSKQPTIYPGDKLIVK